VWVASVPGQRCVRVREGGEVLNTVPVDRGCFACMLGGEDGRTLFITATEWHGMQAAMSDGPDWAGQLLAAPNQPAPTPSLDADPTIAKMAAPAAWPWNTHGETSHCGPD
jgi:sugar lactone lactonase YvrE